MNVTIPSFLPPPCFSKAIKEERWRKAMELEFEALKRNET